MMLEIGLDDHETSHHEPLGDQLPIIQRIVTHPQLPKPRNQDDRVVPLTLMIVPSLDMGTTS